MMWLTGFAYYERVTGKDIERYYHNLLVDVVKAVRESVAENEAKALQLSFWRASLKEYEVPEKLVLITSSR